MRRAVVLFAGLMLPVWSFGVALALWIAPQMPSGRELLYLSLPRPDQTATLFIRDLRHNLEFAVKRDLRGWGIDAAWSPDGSQIVYSSFQYNIVRRDLYIIDLDTRKIERITDGIGDYNSPAWSPDGRYIAYQGILLNTTWDIYLYDLQTGEHRVLYASGGTDGRPAWSPDGQQLIFESEHVPAGNTDIFRYDLRDDTVEPVISSLGGDIMPAWSPDGSQIALVTLGGTLNLALADAQGDNLHLLLTNATDPAWSPDSQLLAFGTTRTQDNYHQHVYIAPADGSGEPRRVTEGDAGYGQPHWRPR